MARIRTIKPEFFTHVGLYELEQETNLPVRVAFAGLWTQCDRDGKFKWVPKQLKLGCLPYDKCDFSLVLDALARVGFIEKYCVSGNEYGCIPSFSTHQVINNRESKSTIPSRPDYDEMKHLYSGVNVPKPVFEQIANRDGRACTRCGSCEDLTIDHVIPQSIEFNNTVENLRVLCRSCNSSRPVVGDALWDDVIDWYSKFDMQSVVLSRVIQMSGRVGTREVHAQVERKGKEGKGREGDICQAENLPDASVQCDDVFDYWKMVMHSHKSKLDTKRKKLINDRLKTYSVDDLKTAIHGCSVSPFHMGSNDRGAKYNSIELILRDSGKIDQFIGCSESPPKAGGSASNFDFDDVSWVKDFGDTL